MSIILNGASYRSVWWWTRHFEDDVENVRTEIVKSQGLASENIRDKMLEMQLMAEGTRCKNFMWIADLSPRPGVSRRFSDEEWERSRQIAEKFRGLEGQPYFVIEQEKADGRIHRHAIWSRVDQETGRARPDGWDSEICHAASRAIREELGLEPLPSPFDKDREGPRPRRAPQRWEMYRGMKSGLDPRDIAAQVTELFHQSDSGRSFHAALELHGYTLAKGDQRGFVILDSAGDDHSLARRIHGVNTKELNAFMRDVDRAALPTVEQGRARHQERTIAALEADRATVRDEIQWENALDRAGIEKEERERRFADPEPLPPTSAANAPSQEASVGQEGKDCVVEAVQSEQKWAPGPELGRTAGEIRLAYSLTQTGQEFADALEDRGFALARVTEADAERLNRWERQRLKELKDLEMALQAAAASSPPVPQKEQAADQKPPPTRADTWMAQNGGVAALTPEFRDQALANYERWHGNKKKYDFANYVAYVQKREAERQQGPGSPEPEQQLYEKYKPGELVVVGPQAQVYQLNYANTGDSAKDRAQHLKDIDRAPILTAIAAENVMRRYGTHRFEEKQQERARKREETLREAREKQWPTNPPEPERKSPGLFEQAANQASRDDRVKDLKGTAAQVWKLWTRIDLEKHAARIGKDAPFSVATDTKAFAAALDEKGIGFAAATKEEADRSHREASFAKAVGNYAPRFKEGEIVIVTAPRPEYRRDGQIVEPPRVQKIDQSLAAKFVGALGSRSELKGIEATKQVLVDRARERAAEWEGIRLKNATNTKRRGRGRTTIPTAPDLAKASGRAMGSVIGALGKLADGFSLDALTPKEKYEAAKRDHKNEREADQNADYAAYMARLSQARQDHDRERAQQQERQPERERDR
jgi:hypothetical protein